jgi:hypothetical protein
MSRVLLEFCGKNPLTTKLILMISSLIPDTLSLVPSPLISILRYAETGKPNY